MRLPTITEVTQLNQNCVCEFSYEPDQLHLFRTLTRRASWRCFRDLSLRMTTRTKPSYWRLQTTGRTPRLKTVWVNITAWSDKAPAKGASKTISADDLETFMLINFMNITLFCLLEQAPVSSFQPIMTDTNSFCIVKVNRLFCYFNRCKIIV